jgi:hypothetical protein
MTHDQVWRGEIANLREQASRRSGWVVCTPDAYLALMDFRPSYRAAVRLDKLNGTNRAARFSPDALCLGRVSRNLDEFLTFDQDEAERLLGRMGWARELSEDGFVACTIQEMVKRRAAAIVEEQQLEEINR